MVRGWAGSVTRRIELPGPYGAAPDGARPLAASGATPRT